MQEDDDNTDAPGEGRYELEFDGPLRVSLSRPGRGRAGGGGGGGGSGDLGTLIVLNAQERTDRPGLWRSGSIVSVKPTPLPLPGVGQVPGSGGSDPRDRGDGIFWWLVVTDSLPTDRAGVNLDAATIEELSEVWNYDVSVNPVQEDAERLRTNYGTAVETIGISKQYAFTNELIEAVGANWSKDMEALYGPGYTWSRQNNSDTTMLINMFFNDQGVPSERIDAAREVWREKLVSAVVESRRYRMSDDFVSMISGDVDKIVEATWVEIEPQIVDGYTV